MPAAASVMLLVAALTQTPVSLDLQGVDCQTADFGGEWTLAGLPLVAHDVAKLVVRLEKSNSSWQLTLENLAGERLLTRSLHSTDDCRTLSVGAQLIVERYVREMRPPSMPDAAASDPISRAPAKEIQPAVEAAHKSSERSSRHGLRLELINRARIEAKRRRAEAARLDRLDDASAPSSAPSDLGNASAFDTTSVSTPALPETGDIEAQPSQVIPSATEPSRIVAAPERLAPLPSSKATSNTGLASQAAPPSALKPTGRVPEPSVRSASAPRGTPAPPDATRKPESESTLAAAPASADVAPAPGGLDTRPRTGDVATSAAQNSAIASMAAAAPVAFTELEVALGAGVNTSTGGGVRPLFSGDVGTMLSPIPIRLAVSGGATTDESVSLVVAGVTRGALTTRASHVTASVSYCIPWDVRPCLGLLGGVRLTEGFGEGEFIYQSKHSFLASPSFGAGLHLSFRPLGPLVLVIDSAVVVNPAQGTFLVEGITPGIPAVALVEGRLTAGLGLRFQKTP
jgi:hypothetical protein